MSRLSFRGEWERLLGGEERYEEYDGWWFRRGERSLVRTVRTHGLDSQGLRDEHCGTAKCWVGL